MLNPAARPASRSRLKRSPGAREPSAGGGRSIIGRRKFATFSSIAWNAGYASASRGEWRRSDSTVAASSLKKNSGGPSAGSVEYAGSSGWTS